MNNLNLEWVNEPDSSRRDDLLDMAEGYPFEKKRRSHQNTDPRERCRTTWDYDGPPSRPFLSAYFSSKLVGWLQVQYNRPHSEELNTSVYDVYWELIQRNRNDIRESMLDELANRFPDSVIHLKQPAQNRTARQYIRNCQNVLTAGMEMYVAQWGEKLDEWNKPDLSRNLRTGFLEKMNNENLRDFVSYYNSSYLHESPIYSQKSASNLHFRWVKNAIDSNRYQDRSLVEDEKLKGFGLYTVPQSSSRRSASISYIQVNPTEQGDGIGSAILRDIISELRTRPIDYVEIKLNANNTQALQFYKHHDFQPVSKREHFYLLSDQLRDALTN